MARYFRSWIDKVREFQSKSKEERDKWCSICGRIGGCNLCTNLESLDLSNLIDYEEEEILNKSKL